MEDRIVRLEENAWFQERKIAELEEDARALRSRLLELEKRHAKLAGAFTQLQTLLAASMAEELGPVSMPPPHWLQEK